MAKGKFKALGITTWLNEPETRAIIELMAFGDVTVQRTTDARWQCRGGNCTAIADELDEAIFTCLRMQANHEELP